jgi:tRNA threonylcarbamoyladenosine biosynthesis protein TsaE
VSALVFRTESEEETIELGRRIATDLNRPSLVLLTGNLGAGKTTLSKGIVAGLGVASEDEVSSPTYTVIHEYGGDVYHIDLYRLDRAEQVEMLGLDEIFDRGAVMLVEWGEAYSRVLPQVNPVEIRITRDGEARTFAVTGLCDRLTST